MMRDCKDVVDIFLFRLEYLEHLNKRFFSGRNIWVAVRRNVRGGSLSRSDGCFRWIAIIGDGSFKYCLLYWFYIPLETLPGNTPLHLAARAGKTTAVATLLHQGATASMKVTQVDDPDACLS